MGPGLMPPPPHYSQPPPPGGVGGPAHVQFGEAVGCKLDPKLEKAKHTTRFHQRFNLTKRNLAFNLNLGFLSLRATTFWFDAHSGEAASVWHHASAAVRAWWGI